MKAADIRKFSVQELNKKIADLKADHSTCASNTLLVN